MTRCSNLAPVLVAALLADPSLAGPLLSDAFGLYDPATSAPERRDWAGWTEGVSVTVIAPREPDRLTIFAGPKSSVAGKDPSHVVAIVVDRFGNLVADGTAATVTVDAVPTATKVVGGITDLLLAPRTRAEELFIGVAAGERQSPQAMLSIVADLASTQPSLAMSSSDVASETAFDVRSAPLADRFGNPPPDGTGASVVLRHADGSFSLAQGLALQDSALVRFIARDIPGIAEAEMTLGAQRSEDVALSIRSPTPSGLPAMELAPLPQIGALQMTLGPFLTTDGYALVDGAEVTVTVALSDGSQLTDAAWVQDGEVSLMLPISDPAAVKSLLVQSPLGPMDLTSDWQAAVVLAPAKLGEGP